MSCLPLAFSSVWIYTISQVSSDVLLCNLAERMNGLTPPLLFIWLFEGSRWHCSLRPLHSAPLGFLSLVLKPSSLQHSSMVSLWRCDRNLHLVAVFQDVPGSIWFVVTPLTFHSAQLIAFLFAIRILVLCWFCRLVQQTVKETFISSYPSHSMINPWGVLVGCTLPQWWYIPPPLLKDVTKPFCLEPLGLFLHGMFIPILSKVYCLCCMFLVLSGIFPNGDVYFWAMFRWLGGWIWGTEKKMSSIVLILCLESGLMFKVHQISYELISSLTHFLSWSWFWHSTFARGH